MQESPRLLQRTQRAPHARKSTQLSSGHEAVHESLVPGLPFGYIETEQDTSSRKPRSRADFNTHSPGNEASVNHRIIGDDEVKKTPTKKNDDDLSGYYASCPRPRRRCSAWANEGGSENRPPHPHSEPSRKHLSSRDSGTDDGHSDDSAAGHRSRPPRASRKLEWSANVRTEGGEAEKKPPKRSSRSESKRPSLPPTELELADAESASQTSDSGLDDEAMLAAQLSSDEDSEEVGSPLRDQLSLAPSTSGAFSGRYGLMQHESFFTEYGGEVDLRSFAYKPVPQHRMALCKITRSRGYKARYPIFTFTFEDPDGKNTRDVLVARRQRHGKAVSYLIATDVAKLEGAHSGKLKANFSCSKFSLFDSGSKQAKKRKEICSVVYTHKSWSNPRGLLVKCPYDDVNGRQRDVCMVNALPEWDPVLKIHSLKFNGRATEVSVKNFKLIKDGAKSDVSVDEEPFFFRLGKVGKDTFNCDYRWPMTPLQAFGIALTSFEGGRAR